MDSLEKQNEPRSAQADPNANQRGQHEKATHLTLGESPNARQLAEAVQWICHGR